MGENLPAEVWALEKTSSRDAEVCVKRFIPNGGNRNGECNIKTSIF